ncbi:DUF3800 domain-containing protein [Kribbella monticola]|uniref:DUF3800 domain-containing protein n=1 Tax=Kribbella monticola TaxID=2185285 RepID=UPI000DD4A495|nr:DUF3800 domain-containing protein [Kribbella monticola]
MKPPVEIACDESGYEGEKLIGGVTDVFAHAAVALDEETAARCIKELRERIRSPATEYKANHVLRSKHRPVLIWLLGSSGPLFGQAQVQLVDKAFFLVSRLVGFLTDTDADGTLAARLYAAGRRTGGPAWSDFLATANNLLRAKDLPEATTPVESFYQALGALPLDELDALKSSRPYADQLRAGLFDDPRSIPPLDPLMPAIVRAIEYWGEPDRTVAIAHDRQTTLSPDRIAQLKQLTGNLAELELVDSFSHPRVQVADFLAGVARKIASDQLKGTDDAELTTLLRPYVDPLSTWSDPSSWDRLTS